ncbi:TonB-dependent receptor plug domain-containing protein [Vibrio harveyi]|uniref:TonB-dependent receptor plug domain-containing protein n=1 Tax=Vibrio harveyi TaxID=669 RepID=UPI0004137A40|nr:TonB-dependent receptor plug domain-containing protein [Vibrio harveyi]
MHPFNKTLLAATIASLCSVSNVYAETETPSETPSDLTVNVTDTRDDELSTKQTLDADDIKDTPSSNGNLTDYLKDNPNVRFAGGDLDGFQGGEIKPVSVSILGADPDQTAYMIDGVNVNNDLDPNGSLFDGTVGTVPSKSSEQAYYIDANLLSGVEVYTSNVPASLGGFTGGAVVAETRQYNGEDRVKLSYRTTQSEWAEMQVDRNIKEKVNNVVPNGYGADFQPDYKKNFFSVMAEQSLTEDIGMVVGFSRRESDIKQKRLINKNGDTDHRNHNRLSDNFLANFNWTPSVERSLELGFRLSNYEEGKYFATNLDNNVTDTHLAYGSTVKWTQRLGSGQLSATAAYDQFTDERKSNATYALVTSDLDNGMDYEEGGYGNSQLTQQNVQLKLHYEFDRLELAGTSHLPSIGAGYKKTSFDFNRDNDVTQKTVMYFFGSIFDERTSTTRKGSVSTDYQDYSFYAEDVIHWNNFTIRPGIRVERDDYLENTNIAPRFSASWFATDQTTLNVGLNRYYGRSFASMKLAGEVLKLNDSETRDYKSVEGLDTEYSDEVSLRADQIAGNFLISAGYVYRDYKKSIDTKVTDTGGKKIYSYYNGSSFSVDTYTLQVSNITPWVLGPTNWTTSLAADYMISDRAEISEPNQAVIYDGKLMTKAQMEQEVNSNKEEWVARVGINMDIPRYNLTWANKVYIKAPVDKHEYQDTVDGIEIYRGYNFGTHTQWDTRLRYQPSLFGTHSAYVQVDVLNVLDQVRQDELKADRQGDYGLYSPGREFWLELGYEF